MILFTREYKHVTRVLPCAKLQYCSSHRQGLSRSLKKNTRKMLREKDHACFKPCIKLALILPIGWSSSPFIIEPRLPHFKVHPKPMQLWVGPPFRSCVISKGAFQWDLSDYVTAGPRKIDEMFLHCTKLTLDHQPLYILDPILSKQDLNG